MTERVDITKSPWDRSTFVGRLYHYFWVTDPRLSFVPPSRLYKSKQLLEQYERKEEPPGTTRNDVIKAQQHVLSAFHPDTGDLQNVFGRMSFYVPGGMVLIGAMITFYKTTRAVIFWQWANQSFNALVNYTNSNATSSVDNKGLAISYVSATSSALVVALGLKRALANHKSLVLQRLVPFAAVAAANMVNIPLMRQSEIIDGVAVIDEHGNEVIKSRYAAIKGISQVVAARILMAAPSMTVLPMFMERLEQKPAFKKSKYLGGICQVLFSGILLQFMVPIGCAVYPQKCSITRQELNILDHKKAEKLRENSKITIPDVMYFNKGL